jgi:photosystem II stability/assembly factor-like uncharacterized protein
VAANGGVYGAAVYALARDPDRPGIRYAGTSTGFAATFDSGATWHVSNQGLPPACQVWTVLPLRRRPTTLLAGCYGADYGNGIYRSTDRGAHWAPDEVGMLPNMAAYALLQGTGPDGVLLAGVDDGIYRSTDGGSTWARVLHGQGSTLGAYSFARDPFSTLTYYAATSNFVYKSVDDGRTWFTVNNGLAGLGSISINQIIADPTMKGRIYLASGDNGIYRSIDAGGSWQHLDNGPDHAYSLLVQPLRAVPAGELTPDLRAYLAKQDATARKAAKSMKAPKLTPETALLLAGTDSGVQASLDGGESWNDRTADANDSLKANALPYPALPDGTAVYALLSFGRSAEILAGTYPGGVYRSQDLARSWRVNGPGLPHDLAINAVATDPAHPGVVYYGTQGDGVERSQDGGGTLDTINDGLPESAAVNDLLIQPARDDRLVAALGAPSGGVAVYNGDSWSRSALGGHFANTVIADPRDPDTLYAGLAHDGIAWSTDGGDSWRILDNGLDPAADVLALAADPHDALRILAGTDRGLYVTTDQGDHWTPLRAGAPGSGLPAGAVTALLDDPAHRHAFLAGTPSELYRSVDGGATWRAAGTGLAGIAIHRLSRDPGAPTVLLAATEAGVFRSADDGTTWLPRDQGFPGPSAATAVTAAGPVAYAANQYGAYFLSPTGPVPARASGSGVYVAAYGHSIAEPFLSFWRAHGGVDVFGYPRTEAMVEGGMLVQYFERARMEYHAAAHRVTLTPLGAQFARGRAFARIAPFANGPLRIYVPQTHHSIAEPFLSYWRSHGGAAVFGYPISEVLHEQNGDGTGKAYTLQYFQNARLEYHPENKGTKYEIQLGLLGQQLLRAKGWLQ